MSGIAFLAAALVAFLCALADSALLAARLRAGADIGVPNTAPLPRREADRQALVFGRVLAQLGAGAAFARWTGLSEFSFVESLGLALLGAALAVAVTEAAARELGDALAERGVRALAPFMRVVALLLSPFVALTLRLDESLRRALPAPATAEAEREETAEQFRQVVASEADVTRDEQALLAGVFSLGDTLVHEVMVPRVDVIAVDQETPWADVVARVRSAEHSRLPVYAETVDEIVGVLYAKDLLPSVIDDEPPPGGWTSLVKPATFIPTTKRIDDQLRDFRASGSHMAVVVDEYGGTAGIVTIEDVLEEIVGEIRDEHDDEDAPIESEGEDCFWVEGRVTLDELSDTVGEDLRMDDVSTVGGLVYELLGRVPRAGERLTYRGFRVVVERVMRRQVRRVYFERLEPPAESDGAAEGRDS